MKNYNSKPKPKNQNLLLGDVIIPDFSPVDDNIHGEHLDSQVNLMANNNYIPIHILSFYL
jgi:hypothetical protein